jgi:hypothetical protein
VQDEGSVGNGELLLLGGSQFWHCVLGMGINTVDVRYKMMEDRYTKGWWEKEKEEKSAQVEHKKEERGGLANQCAGR